MSDSRRMIIWIKVEKAACAVLCSPEIWRTAGRGSGEDTEVARLACTAVATFAEDCIAQRTLC